MKEIPIPYVRSNQWGIVLSIVFALVIKEPLIIAVLLLIQAAGLFGGIKRNLFIQVLKPLLKKQIVNSQTEAAELQRFNNSIAVSMLALSVIFFMIGWHMAGYVMAGMVALAAFIAICGFCIGCVLYFQFKQWKARMNRRCLIKAGPSMQK